MTSFDWASLSAARGARLDAVPEMINHALTVLAELLEQINHACEFRLTMGSLFDRDVAESVSRLLPDGCFVQGLEWVPRWRALVSEVLPGLFVPSWEPDVWMKGATARTLAESLAAWTLALMGRLWPDDAECWNLTVRCDDWYTAFYVDVVINHGQQVWLLHLEVTD